MKKNSNFHLLSYLTIGFAIVIFTNCTKNDLTTNPVDLTNRIYKGIRNKESYWYKSGDNTIYTYIIHYNYLYFTSSKELSVGLSEKLEKSNSTESEITYSHNYTYTIVKDSLKILNSDGNVEFSGKYSNQLLILKDYYNESETTFQLQN